MAMAISMVVLLFSEPCMHGCASRCLGNPRSPSTPYKRIPWGRARPRYAIAIAVLHASASLLKSTELNRWYQVVIQNKQHYKVLGKPVDLTSLIRLQLQDGKVVKHEDWYVVVSSAAARIYICICFSGQTYSMNNGDIYDDDGAGGTGSLSRTGTRWACRWWADSQRPAAGAPCCSPTHSWASAKTQPSLLLLRHFEFVRLGSLINPTNHIRLYIYLYVCLRIVTLTHNTCWSFFCCVHKA